MLHSKRFKMMHLLIMSSASQQLPIRWEIAADDLIGTSSYRTNLTETKSWKKKEKKGNKKRKKNSKAKTSQQVENEINLQTRWFYLWCIYSSQYSYCHSFVFEVYTHTFVHSGHNWENAASNKKRRSRRRRRMITTTTMEMEMEIRKKRNMGLLTRLCLVSPLLFLRLSSSSSSSSFSLNGVFFRNSQSKPVHLRFWILIL